jgi:hypothetical protein
LQYLRSVGAHGKVEVNKFDDTGMVAKDDNAARRCTVKTISPICIANDGGFS